MEEPEIYYARRDPHHTHHLPPQDWYEIQSIRSSIGGSRKGTTRGSSVGPSSTPPKKWSRFKNALRLATVWIFSNVGICILVNLYLILGALVFQQIEGDVPQVAFRVGSYRNLTVQRLWSITETYNTLHKNNWTSEIEGIIKEYQERIITDAFEGYDGNDEPASQWTFEGALLYSITVITTIGYGHIAPKTSLGKLITILYAIVGMPLFLLYLSNIGDIMAKSFKWTYYHCCKCKRGPPQQRSLSQEQEEEEEGSLSSYTLSSDIQEFESTGADPCHRLNREGGGSGSKQSSSGDPLANVTVPISMCLLAMVAYICGGAVLFGEWEEWGFLDGSYFCFITLSTIGFGDIVPGDSITDDDLSGDEIRVLGEVVNTKFIFCSMYIILGMAVIAMCFNLMQEKVVQGVRTLGKKIGIIKDD